MSILPPFNFWKLVDECKHELQPPVGNKMLYNDGDFKVMVVGGPNQRTDYHWEVGPEWFFQLKGNMCVKIVDPVTGEFRDVPINEGEMFMLPGKTYHSPQRTADSIGIVIERERKPEEEHDRLAWFCQKPECREKIHEASFHCTNLGLQLKPVIEQYYTGPKEGRTCKKCGFEEQAPEKYRNMQQ
eukprot:GDKI01038687.1.p1 GENE.GDKI01038687.1~~GDKI01038687.1.p1  ORF type:complete len:196 (+),score=60.04 GDKI01038687.1:36-590(+)